MIDNGKVNRVLVLGKGLLPCLLVALTLSFAHGWYFDGSTPRSGMGWADQSYYHVVAEKLATGTELGKGDFHYQLGYSILGALFYHILPSDPFMPVSLLLLLGSGYFLCRGAKTLFSLPFQILFLFFVFVRIGDVRELYYAQEIFLNPWNNQVAFFCMAFYFYLFAGLQQTENITRNTILAAGIVTGVTISAREEMLLFAGPLFLALFFFVRTENRHYFWIASFLAVLMYSPNLIFKYLVFDSMFDNVRPTDSSSSYVAKLAGYLDLGRLLENGKTVLYDSALSGLEDVNRKAWLQASPWMWLAPIGIVWLFFRKRHFMSLYVISALFLFVFYLAGENMNAQKLKFHCLRYISPAFIAITFLLVYGLENTWSQVKRMLCQVRSVKSQEVKR